MTEPTKEDWLIAEKDHYKILSTEAIHDYFELKREIDFAVKNLKFRIQEDESFPYCAECDSLKDLFDLIDDVFVKVVKK